MKRNRSMKESALHHPRGSDPLALAARGTACLRWRGRRRRRPRVWSGTLTFVGCDLVRRCSVVSLDYWSHPETPKTKLSSHLRIHTHEDIGANRSFSSCPYRRAKQKHPFLGHDPWNKARRKIHQLFPHSNVFAISGDYPGHHRRDYPGRHFPPRRGRGTGADDRRVQQHARSRGTDRMRARRRLHRRY